jgi:hypothetical protein
MFDRNMAQIRKKIDAETELINRAKNPVWKPEDLIGKLVHAENGCTVGAQKEQDGILLRISDHGIPKNYRYEVADGWYSDILPLTEAEALALVWRPKPKTRYDWSKAPEGATHGCINDDNSGNWLVHATDGDPKHLSNGSWSCGSSGGFWKLMKKDCILDASGDWRDSLERRPE